MRDCNPGERRLPGCRFRQLGETYGRRGRSRAKSVRVEGAALSAPKIWDTTARVPPGSRAKEMPDRASLAIRHLVDVQLAAAKTELCVTVVFFELWFLSIPKSLRH